MTIPEIDAKNGEWRAEGFLPIKFLMWGPCSVVIVVWLLGEENMEAVTTTVSAFL